VLVIGSDPVAWVGGEKGNYVVQQKDERAINRQICNEFSAMMQYVAIASHFVEESLHELAAHFYRRPMRSGTTRCASSGTFWMRAGMSN
jgi:hypothetical protein